MNYRRIATLVTGVLVLLSASASVAAPLDARIRWTTYGVPHVEAKNFLSLGYGYGYAIAADRLCLLADRMVTLRGIRSRSYGADGPAVVGFLPTDNLNSDLFHRVQLSDMIVAKARRKLSPDARALAKGYALGFNRYLSEMPKRERYGACGSAPIPSMEEADVIRAMQAIGTIWKAFQIAPYAAVSAWNSTAPVPARSSEIRRPPPGIGSNVWSYGADATGTGSALVLANPHTFWQDGWWLAMHQLHLSIPGKLDVAGAVFVGLPTPVIGFNADLAWSMEAPSTVTYYVLQKMQVEDGVRPAYVVDGKRRPLRIAPVHIDVKLSEGPIVRRTFLVAWSALGPLYRLPAAPGRPEGWYAVTDAGEGNARGLDQMLAIARAKTIAEFQEATERYRGLGSHLIAGDRHGDALYVEAGPLLGVDEKTLASCRVDGAFPAVLDGTRSDCFLRNRRGMPKLMLPKGLPALSTRGIVQNANNSYHLSIHGEQHDGYSSLLGAVGQHDLRIQMSERRMREVMSDGRATPAEALEVVFDNRNYAAETWLDDILQSCGVSAATRHTRRGCAILRRWDRTNNATSRGVLVFELLWARMVGIPGLLSPFDDDDPFAVRQMSGSPEILAAIATALDETMRQIAAAGLTGVEPWGEILAAEGPKGKVPLHGGDAGAGVLNALAGAGLGPDGFASIVNGSAYLQLVQWKKGRVVAETVLAHGQSADPASPHHSDQLENFSEKRLVRMPFSRKQIAAETVRSVRLRGMWRDEQHRR